MKGLTWKEFFKSFFFVYFNLKGVNRIKKFAEQKLNTYILKY